ncbi:hypothetical protein VDG1235_3737 [Verrucomicrobiia bacterium DG1235]|nr:hypothetical protein VDG1235_3737 [Verrucomicrobiae bacterium DG1235]
MLLSLLFLIILAVMAYQSRKIVLPAIVFGMLKAVASCFYAMAESDFGYGLIAMLASSQFLANGLLGAAIAYLVVKRSQDWKYAFATTALSVFTFLTSAIDPMIVS